MNLSSISNNASALNEDENLIKQGALPKNVPDKIEDSQKRRLSKDERPKKYSIQHDNLPVIQPSLRARIAKKLETRTADTSVICIILLYTTVVLINTFLDDGDGTNNDQTVDDVLGVLKYIELFILILFMLEILVKAFIYGLRVILPLN